MLRVLIDGFYIDRDYGFGRYVRELAYALRYLSADIRPVLLVPTNAERLARSVAGPIEVQAHRSVPFPFWEQVILPKVARRMRCDLVHFPYQTSCLIWPGRATVVTIHDLMFLRRAAKGSPLADRAGHLYRRAAFYLHTRHARRLIAVSDSTRREIGVQVHVDASTIHNTCEAFVRSMDCVEPTRAEGRFFLHRGHAGPHKNTRRILEAFARLRKHQSDVRLLVYGMHKSAQRMDPPMDGVTFLGRLTDAELAALYKASLAVVVASIEEGFGLSIIEAMGFGTAVITSNFPPMSEVGGVAAVLVDPHDVAALENAMRRIASEPEHREALIKRGHERFQAFSTTRFAASLSSVYRAQR